MARRPGAADHVPVAFRGLLAVVVGALALSSLFGEMGDAFAGNPSCRGASGNGYTYAGHQASQRAHGVRATVTATRTPQVHAGHVSGWIGVGGPGQGANGEDAWIQVGIAAMQGVEEPFLYAEIARGGRQPRFILLESGVEIGASRSLAVVETAGRPGSWRVVVEGRPATAPVRLRGSSGRWAPIATAESWNGGRAACNGFAYRFEGVSVARTAGGSWRPFVSGHRFLDRGHLLRSLTPSVRSGARALSGEGPSPFAFAATS